MMRSGFSACAIATPFAPSSAVITSSPSSRRKRDSVARIGASSSISSTLGIGHTLRLRQRNSERRALARDAPVSDAPAMHVDAFLHDREAEPGAGYIRHVAAAMESREEARLV